MIHNAKDPQYTLNGRINLLYEHPALGFIPFTASLDDTEELGRTLFANAQAGEYGEIAPYVPPPKPPTVIPARVTMRQARLALLANGLLDTVTAAIGAMEGAAGQAAQIEWEYATNVERGSSLIAGLAAALALDDAEIDALFLAAAAL
ncbi:MAG: hypothetical protein LBU43_13065 [Candidatus Accumulibacter sp.]|jgi:hypothetical protein|nr:hypothetical protein [Accumulibacter sp.]